MALHWPLGACGTQCRALLEMDTRVNSIPVLTEWLRLKGNCSSRLPRTMSRWLLHISKERDSMTTLGNLCEYSVTFTVKTCSLMFKWDILFFGLCPFPLVPSLDTTDLMLGSHLSWSL